MNGRQRRSQQVLAPLGAELGTFWVKCINLNPCKRKAEWKAESTVPSHKSLASRHGSSAILPIPVSLFHAFYSRAASYSSGSSTYTHLHSFLTTASANDAHYHQQHLTVVTHCTYDHADHRSPAPYQLS